MNTNIEHLKYPIGTFKSSEIISETQIKDWIKTIRNFPTQLKLEVKDLSVSDLKKTYRPNGWNIMQVVHHCADSHMNSFIRCKLALTEETPTIKPYHENLWAELPDANNPSIESSLIILEGLHQRWTFLLDSLNASDLNKSYFHPESQSYVNLKTNIGIYAWHCEHHLAHIKIAKNS
ncbi:putative metal-dependent hydrolase [Aestuariibaculum sp. M13]|uniref:YfiT family bacillithiol transferase n=1 Tax=Aestuariibaculum sp. M13 TaxID=2967132 RepID=UPI002159CC94|nr:putative metal-dependent hydrolase [Aestuariibaculum sp. M13]MCR8666976.1 putative metal-dependent hydrolase [Aestuariibaculum sp. M13]